jgi:Ca-activated chloride channel family protein
MRIRHCVCILAGICFAQEPIHVQVNLVNIGFSVRDAGGKLVSGLTQDDFDVFEDGAPQKIAFFARSDDVPLSLGLIMDFSGSQESFIKAHDRDLEKFLKDVLRPEDRAFLLCFGNQLHLASDYSSSHRALTEDLRNFGKGKVEPPRIGPHERRILGTAFYDAIYYSITEKLADVSQGRRALVIFSDGEDNSSAHHMMDAIETAQTNDVRLFAVRYTDVRNGVWNARNKYGMRVMERIARETGGADFDAREKGLEQNFKEIGEQLHFAYELAYHTTNPVSDGTFHKIVIRSKQPGMVVQAKTGYYARDPASEKQR